MVAALRRLARRGGWTVCGLVIGASAAPRPARELPEILEIPFWLEIWSSISFLFIGPVVDVFLVIAAFSQPRRYSPIAIADIAITVVHFYSISFVVL